MNSIYRVTEQGDRTWGINNSKWGTVVLTRCKFVMIGDRHRQSFVNKGAERLAEPCPGLCHAAGAGGSLSSAGAQGEGGLASRNGPCCSVLGPQPCCQEGGGLSTDPSPQQG